MSIDVLNHYNALSLTNSWHSCPHPLHVLVAVYALQVNVLAVGLHQAAVDDALQGGAQVAHQSRQLPVQVQVTWGPGHSAVSMCLVGVLVHLRGSSLRGSAIHDPGESCSTTPRRHVKLAPKDCMSGPLGDAGPRAAPTRAPPIQGANRASYVGKAQSPTGLAWYGTGKAQSPTTHSKRVQ